MFEELEEKLITFYQGVIRYTEEHHEIPPPEQTKEGSAIIEQITQNLEGRKLTLVLYNAYSEAWFSNLTAKRHITL